MQAQLRREIQRLFETYGVSSEIREAIPASSDEIVFVVPPREAARMDEGRLTEELTRLLRRKVWVVIDGPAWEGLTRPVSVADQPGRSLAKSAVAEQIANRVGISRRQATQALEELAGLAYREARRGFTVPGIGKLVLANRRARFGRNPRTGNAIQIPAKRVVKFRVAKQAKDAILGTGGGTTDGARRPRRQS